MGRTSLESVFEDFSGAVRALAVKYHVIMPLHSKASEGILYTRPTLYLRKVSDKQKIFKLIDEYSDLVERHGGHLIADAGEGRIKARFAHKHLDDDVRKLFAAIKTIFDPHGVLNPGGSKIVFMAANNFRTSSSRCL